MPRFFALLFVAGSLVTAGLGQPAVDSAGAFDIRVHGTIIGHEAYKMVATKLGFTLTSTVDITVGGTSLALQQEQTLDPEWGLLHYTLKAAQQATVEAWKDAGKFQMQVQTGGQTIPKTAELLPHTLVLDNNVTSHFQVLLNQFRQTSSAQSQEFQLLVPQILQPIKATLAVSGTDKGVFGGKPVALTRYVLTLSALTLQIWADDQGRLMLVSQTGSDAVRPGFELTRAVSGAEEKRLTFPSGDLQIPATLLLPGQKKDKLPLVVLVSGSGANDRDETMGPNKPFLDLAQGLAAHGIATLRYDKRTFAFPEKLDVHHFTVQEEVIDDAVAALQYARGLPQVDAGNVFLLGHSQGAELAPFILEQASQAGGAILMAAPGRPLDLVLFEQIEFQGQVHGQQKEAAARVEQLKARFAAIRDGTLPDSEMVFGAPAFYYRDLFKRDQMAALHNTKVPLLVLQGGRDVQVLSKDYDLVTAAVPQALLEKHFFPELNHLFLPAKKGATGEEIATTPGHIGADIIDVIAGWVAEHSKTAK